MSIILLIARVYELILVAEETILAEQRERVMADFKTCADCPYPGKCRYGKCLRPKKQSKTMGKTAPQGGYGSNANHSTTDIEVCWAMP